MGWRPSVSTFGRTKPSRVLISDASPLIYLTKTGHLALVGAVYEDVTTTEVVLSELRAVPTEAEYVRSRDWIAVVSEDRYDDQLERVGKFDLDPGERSAIALALTQPAASTLLIDELAGRATARTLGLAVVGSLGLLGKAKETGAIATVRPIADAMIEAGWYMKPSFYANFLRSIGE